MRDRIANGVITQPVWQSLHGKLDEQLLLAHANNDKDALVILYRQAADMAERHDDTNAARFYLTNAYIFALDIGHSEHAALQKRLDAYHADSGK